MELPDWARAWTADARCGCGHTHEGRDANCRECSCPWFVAAEWEADHLDRTIMDMTAEEFLATFPNPPDWLRERAKLAGILLRQPDA